MVTHILNCTKLNLMLECGITRIAFCINSKRCLTPLRICVTTPLNCSVAHWATGDLCPQNIKLQVVAYVPRHWGHIQTHQCGCEVTRLCNSPVTSIQVQARPNCSWGATVIDWDNWAVATEHKTIESSIVLKIKAWSKSNIFGNLKSCLKFIYLFILFL